MDFYKKDIAKETICNIYYINVEKSASNFILQKFSKLIICNNNINNFIQFHNVYEENLTLSFI